MGQAVGFADGLRSGVTVNAGVTVTVNIPLQIAGVNTVIDVSAATRYLTQSDRPWQHP